MAVNFTPDQQKVIDLRDCNILVSADRQVMPISSLGLDVQ